MRIWNISFKNCTLRPQWSNVWDQFRWLSIGNRHTNNNMALGTFKFWDLVWLILEILWYINKTTVLEVRKTWNQTDYVMHYSCRKINPLIPKKPKIFQLLDLSQSLTHWAETKCCHFAVDIFKCIFVNENVWVSVWFVPKVWLKNNPPMVQIMAWH